MDAMAADGGERHRRAYEEFQRLVQSNKLQSLSTMEQLYAYAMDVAERLKCSTALQYLSSVKAYAQLLDPTFLGSHSEELQYVKLRQNIRRIFEQEDEASRRKKHAVTQEDLVKLIDAAELVLKPPQFPPDWCSVVVATMVVLFNGMMRPGELLGDEKQRAKIRNVEFWHSEQGTGQFGRIKLTSRKTALSDRSWRRIVEFTNSMVQNPVAKLRYLCTRAELKGEECLVPLELNMRQSSFWSILRRLAKAAGLPEDKYSPHCFRSGGLQYLLKRGVPKKLAMRQGGWNSDNGAEPYLKGFIDSHIGEIHQRLSIGCDT